MKILNFLKRSLKVKFMLIFSGLLLSMSVISYYSSYSEKKADSMRFAGEHIRTLSEMLAFSVGAGLSEGNFDIVQTAFAWSKKDPNIIYVDILDETDNTLVMHNPSKITLNKKEILSHTQIVENEGYLAIHSAIEYKGQKLGNIIMAYSLEEMKSELMQQALMSLMISIIIFAVGIVIIYTVTQILIRQINRLKDAAVKVGQGDLSVNIKSRRTDELGQLAEALRRMIGDLKSASDSLLDEKQKAETAVQAAEMQKGMLEEQKNYLADKVDMILKEMNRFSQGDLTVELKVENEDVIGKLFAGFNNAVSNTRRMIASVSESIQATASAANEISSSSEELAAGATEQSHQTNEVVCSVEEMTKNILETAKNVATASQLSKEANTAAKTGAETIENAKRGMNEISTAAGNVARTISTLSLKTEQIGEITQVIDDIADQTNLLALNAAIEAARAGEQGRGFAVVADEVRKLAERTTSSTKEIAETIKAIQKEARDADSSMSEADKSVKNGIRLTEEVEAVLKKILEGTGKVASVINEVALASEEQSTSAEQISKNIEGISCITEQSASGTSQIARAAEDLGRLTTTLQDLINNFRIGESSTGFAGMAEIPAVTRNENNKKIAAVRNTTGRLALTH